MTASDTNIEILFKRHFAQLHRFAFILMHNEDEARDLVHDVFSQIVKNRPENLSETYLRNAVRNRCLNRIRMHSTQERIKRFYTLDEDEIENEEWPDEDIISRLYEEIGHLPEPTRTIVRLRFTDGMTFFKIAATYTFGFCKEVRRGDEVNRISGADPAILK